MDTKEILQLFKMDIGILGTKRDEYYKKLISTEMAELASKGIVLQNNVEDLVLVSDLAAWKYRNRMQNVEAVSKNLQIRIRNRVVKERAKGKI